MDPSQGVQKPNGCTYVQMGYKFRIYEETQDNFKRFSGRGKKGDYVVVSPIGGYSVLTKAAYNLQYPPLLSADSIQQLQQKKNTLSSRKFTQNPNLITEVVQNLNGRLSNRTTRAASRSRTTTTSPAGASTPSPGGGGGY